MYPTQLPLFITVTQEGSFSAAGRKLGLSPAAVSKAISVLEKDIGVRLFHRNTRQLSLTEGGDQLFQKIQPLVAELQSSIDDLSEQNTKPKGKVRVNLPDGFGREFIMPCIPEFLSLYPEIELDLVFDDKVIDIVESGFDIGLGFNLNEDSRLVARELFLMPVGIYASKEYVRLHGIPKTLEELQYHNAIIYYPLNSTHRGLWSLKNQQNELYQFAPQGNLRVSSFSAIKTAVLSHIGLAYLGQLHVMDELNDALIVPVLKDYWPDTHPVRIYYSSKKNLPKRVRLFIEFIIENMRNKIRS